MQYDELELLRRTNGAWRLLCADNAPLILGFLGRVFVEENARSLPHGVLVDRLDDELYDLRAQLGEQAFPRSPQQYLDDWSAAERGWLRKYYPARSDEAHYDITPAVERAVAFASSLRARAFVGTESRLNTLFDLLRQLAFGTETDPDVRVAELERQRAAIDAEITAVRGGDVDVLDAAAQRERYQQFAAMATELLADFREVEANFRTLDRQLRERIAASNGAKGELLDEVVGSRSSISDSDQGRSFDAFYDLLLSTERQEELADLLEKVHGLEALGEIDPRMRRIHHDWLDAGERTQATVRLLSEQLRRFLDDQVWLENRRVMDILRNIEQHALDLRDTDVGGRVSTEVDGVAADLGLPLERPIYRPSAGAALDSSVVAASADDIDTAALFDQVYVDPTPLAETVRGWLAVRDQVGLARVVGDAPLSRGLAEVVTYMALSDPAFSVVFDETRHEELTWSDESGRARTITLPRVTFVRPTVLEAT